MLLDDIDSFTNFRDKVMFNTATLSYRFRPDNTAGDFIFTIGRLEYQYGIAAGLQGVIANNGGNDWDGNPCQQLTAITFNSRGLIDNTAPNTIPLLTAVAPPRFYLENEDQVTTYAAEVRVAGSLSTRKFDGTNWQL